MPRSHPVPVPNRSGHYNCWTNSMSVQIGTLTPALCKEVFPGDDIRLNMSCIVQLPPMATDFYGRIWAKFEAFFVPNRLLWGGWKDFITDKKAWPNSLAQAQPVLRPETLPSLVFDIDSENTLEQLDAVFGPGTLPDYLNARFEFGPSVTSGTLVISNALPFFAYHRIYDDWYRNKRVQTPLFVPQMARNVGFSAANNPWLSVNDSPITALEKIGPQYTHNGFSVKDVVKDELYDGLTLLDLRQRNWRDDYFTSGTFEPQAGDDTTVGITVDGDSGEFTISSLRAANSLQQFKERNNVAGPEYEDQIYARFGVRPADAFTNRSVYLGSYHTPVYVKSVYQTVNDSANVGAGSDFNNPFVSVATKFGSPVGSGDGDLLGRVGGEFHATEHGFLMVIASIVPEVLYSSGVDRMFTRSKLGDIPDPMFQAVGQQAIMVRELDGSSVDFYSTTTTPLVFNYNDRYIELNEYNSEVHGLLRDGQSLESFSLQRSFGPSSRPVFGDEFLQIPKNYLDQVGAVASDVSRYGSWMEIGFAMSKTSVFTEYAIPTLGFPANMHSVNVPDGGTKID